MAYNDDSKVIDYSLLEKPNLKYMKEEIDKLLFLIYIYKCQPLDHPLKWTKTNQINLVSLYTLPSYSLRY